MDKSKTPSHEIGGLIVGQPMDNQGLLNAQGLMPFLMKALYTLYSTDESIFNQERKNPVPILFVDERRTTVQVFSSLRNQHRNPLRLNPRAVNEISKAFKSTRDTGAAVLILDTFLQLQRNRT